MEPIQQISTEEIMSEMDESLSENPKEETIEIQTKTSNVILDSQVFTTLMSCGRKTDFRFNRHFQSHRGKSKGLQKGSAVHEALENYYKNLIKGLDKKSAIGFAMIAGEEYMSSAEWNQSDEEKESVRTTLEKYFEHRKNDYWIPLEVESVKGVLLYEDDEIRILWKVKFDLIVDTNQGIISVDHKTMSQRRETSSLNNQFIGQSIVSGVPRVCINKIGFQTSLKMEERFERVILSYDSDRLDEWKNIVVPYWAKIYLMYEESGYWPPNFTACETKYGFCEYRRVCEANRNDRERVLSADFFVGEPWDIQSVSMDD